MRRARPRRSEDGAVLIMALVFLTVSSLVVAALLSFADTNFRTTVNVRDQGKVLYAADSAVDAAINAYRSGAGCTGPYTGPAVNNLPGATVTCTAVTSSSGAPANAPALAVIARATKDSGEDGIVQVSNETLRVRGGLFSNNTVNTSAGSNIEVDGTLTARWGCNRPDQITATAGVSCDIKNASYPPGEDPPGFTPAMSSVPALAALPSCTSDPVVFQPGTYNNRAALTALFESCPARTFHFPPKSDGSVGVYYFDFDDPGTHEWTIANPSTVVIGGTLSGSSDPGTRCKDKAPGVQFVFGNDSRLAISSGAVELCAQHDPSEATQEVAVYGLTAGDPPPVAPVAVSHPPATPSTVVASTGFANPDRGRVIDAATADATVSSSDATADSITVGGFNLTAIPVGSAVNEVKVRLRHRDRIVSPSGASLDGNLTLSGSVTNTTGTSVTLADRGTCSPRCLTKSDSLHDDVVDVSSTFPSLTSLNGLRVALSAEASRLRSEATTFTELLDGVQLEVKYTPPAPAPVPRLRAQAGCIRVVPYDPASATSCAVLKTSGSGSSLSVRGTVYSPLAALDMQLTSVSYQVFGRGVIVRHLRSNVTSSASCSTAAVPCTPFQLPAAVAGPGEAVFVAKVDGRTRLRAHVQFPASNGSPIVRSWSVVNEPG
jgi:Tfp pilus assembly protein PilX